jgi:hypothetical protein
VGGRPAITRWRCGRQLCWQAEIESRCWLLTLQTDISRLPRSTMAISPSRRLSIATDTGTTVEQVVKHVGPGYAGHQTTETGRCVARTMRADTVMAGGSALPSSATAKRRLFLEFFPNCKKSAHDQHRRPSTTCGLSVLDATL